MVAKRPEDRQQSMAEVIADLEALMPRSGVALLGTPSSEAFGDQALPRRGVPSRATRSDARPLWWRDWRKLAAASAGSLLAILLGIWAVVRDKEGNEVARVRLPAGGSVTQESDGGGKDRRATDRKLVSAWSTASGSRIPASSGTRIAAWHKPTNIRW